MYPFVHASAPASVLAAQTENAARAAVAAAAASVAGHQPAGCRYYSYSISYKQSKAVLLLLLLQQPKRLRSRIVVDTQKWIRC